MAWRLTGQFIESCSCNMLCPCWFGTPELAIQDQGYCSSAIAVRVQQGSAGDVDLSGRTVALALDFSDMMFAGNGTARLYVEQDANADQRRELEAIFQGKVGGPMAVVGGLVTNWLPTQAAAITIDDKGDEITVAVGGAGEVVSRRLKDPGGQGFTLQGGGFVAGLSFDAGAEMAPSASQWSDSAMPRRFQTKSGARGSITWSGG
jgi:hypothetical protein